MDLALFLWFAGSLDDINVMQRSHLFAQLASRKTPACNYTVNGHDYIMGYYLADGIYPSWSTFVKTISDPKIKKHNFFAEAQYKLAERVLRGHLVYCKLSLPLFEVLLASEIKNLFETL